MGVLPAPSCASPLPVPTHASAPAHVLLNVGWGSACLLSVPLCWEPSEPGSSGVTSAGLWLSQSGPGSQHLGVGAPTGVCPQGDGGGEQSGVVGGFPAMGHLSRCHRGHHWAPSSWRRELTGLPKDGMETPFHGLWPRPPQRVPHWEDAWGCQAAGVPASGALLL